MTPSFGKHINLTPSAGETPGLSRQDDTYPRQLSGLPHAGFDCARRLATCECRDVHLPVQLVHATVLVVNSAPAPFSWRAFLRSLLELNDGPWRWRVGIEAGVAVAIPLLLFTLAGHQAVGLMASLGTFTVIYFAATERRSRLWEPSHRCSLWQRHSPGESCPDAATFRQPLPGHTDGSASMLSAAGSRYVSSLPS